MPIARSFPAIESVAHREPLRASHALNSSQLLSNEQIRHNPNHSSPRGGRLRRGQKDEAFQWLEHAYELKDTGLTYMKGDPFLKHLEGDPRYTAFLRKMKLPE